MATTNDKLSTDADHDPSGETKKPSSPNKAKFAEVVKALLAEKNTHRELKQLLSQLVLEEAQKLPPIKVVHGASHAGYYFSKAFIAFVQSHTNITVEVDSDSLRCDPTFIQAISDYGRFICNKYPFVLNDMRTVYTWNIEKVLANLKKSKEMEFNPDLVAKVTSFTEQMSDSKGHWRKDCLGSLPKNDLSADGPDLETFTGKYPDFWMAHYSMLKSYEFAPSGFQLALRFAHSVLQGGDHARYDVVEPDESQDAVIYERIGLCGASDTSAKLAIREIPALVDFSIHEYDGMESVHYGC